MTASDVLIVSNIDPDADEVVYSNDRGTWNVSRALRDCKAGKHKCWRLDVAAAYEASINVEVDEARVAVLMQVYDFEPLLGVDEGGMIWLIDGHHRLRVMHRRGEKEFTCYVIEEADAKPYLVLYNGQRVMSRAQRG